MIEAILAKVDDPNARAEIGRYLQRLSRELIAAADRDDEMTADLARRHAVNARYKQLAQLVTRVVVLQRLALDDAVDLVARRFRLDEIRLAAWWRSVEGRRSIRALRDERIMRHVAAGRHDAELAALFDMHCKSVNRIVRRGVRSGGWRRGAPAGGRAA